MLLSNVFSSGMHREHWDVSTVKEFNLKVVLSLLYPKPDAV